MSHGSDSFGMQRCAVSVTELSAVRLPNLYYILTTADFGHATENGVSTQYFPHSRSSLYTLKHSARNRMVR